MYIKAGLIIALSALSSAVPTIYSKRCSDPTSFDIRGLGYFKPSSTNTNPISLSFTFSDTSATNSTTLCHSSTELNPTTPSQCNSGAVEWVWDGATLTVGETYISCADGYVILRGDSARIS